MIKLENINKLYKDEVDIYALKDITLDIDKNELVLLEGVSGSGKSTLLNLIAGFITPTDGFLEVNDEQIVKFSDTHLSSFRLENIGFVFQAFNLFENLTVYDNIAIALIPLGLENSDADELVKRSMKLANIEHKSFQIVSKLSGGEKQRCAIARAIVNRPELILFDEPTANLDMGNSIKFIEIIKDLREIGKTIVIATHDPIFEEYLDIDKKIALEYGQIVE